MPDPHAVADNLCHGKMFKKISQSAGMIDMDVCNQDIIYSIHMHGIERFEHYLH